MRKEIVGIGLILLLSLNGCATLKKEGLKEEERRLGVAEELKFDDVPLPAGFKLDTQNSFIFQNEFTRVGLLRYIGKADVGDIIKFYKEQMPLHNWTTLNIVEYGRVILNFEKEKETCIITLEPVITRVMLTISIAPKAGKSR